LAFHPYPQVIPQVFNLGGFGPPRRLTGASPCPWVDHSASGLGRATKIALFGLAFATAAPHGLTSPHIANSQAHSSKGTQSRREQAPKTLQRLVGTRFQVLFHSPPGVLFIFPSRYLSAIGHQRVFRLTGWSRQIHSRFLGPRATWDPLRQSAQFRLRGCYPLCRPFRMAFAYHADFLLSARAPARTERSHDPGTATPGGYHAVPV
jgi:hypothetical protein